MNSEGGAIEAVGELSPEDSVPETRRKNIMKTKLLTFLITVALLNAFSQGKILLSNDSLHLVVFNPGAMLPADAAYAGQPIPASPLPSGLNLYIALYGGAASASLNLQTTYPLTPPSGFLSPGRFGSKNVLLDFAGGSVSYFQIYFWSSLTGDPLPSAVTGGSDLRSYGTINPFYYGSTPLFTAIPGTSLSYPNIATAASTSTWAPGDVTIVGAPEPSSLALFGLGAGLMCLLRRAARVKHRLKRPA